jgi:Holliday junction resolvasome RuvABC endonuclease subunit
MVVDSRERMRVVGLRPSTNVVQVVLVDGDKASFTVPFREEWKLADDERLNDYVEIRKRLVERMRRWKPDAACIEQLEGLALTMRPSMSWFKTAELRGVLAEATASEGIATEFRTDKNVTASIGTKAAECRADNAFWDKNLGSDFLKKYRQAVLVALSRIWEE